ncbi:MAG: sigma-54 dependent transcriptional regulator [Treponemataceae bacterium]|nr:MAG: sigma-54 dependent transcriptional regulator [Treponemataceae bacterium]
MLPCYTILMRFTLLIIDDEKNIREGLRDAMELEGYAVKLAENGKQGLELIAKAAIDLVITDLRMPELSGEKVLAAVAAENPGIPVIVLTGHGSIDTAVNAMRAGAYDFLTKPVNIDQLTLIVRRALEAHTLALRHKNLEDELRSKTSFESIIGKDAEMQKIFTVLQKAADSKASILITGESGVGKELIADALHNISSRRDKPFIQVHCAALSETLLESELFGHEKGAFTGAVARRRGRFELAHGGTIFLDEIGEINQSVQIKILRVLQEKKFERVGGEETIDVDIRIVAATNRDLKKEIAEGRFREDLYYRLNVVHIHVPPLRERRADIPLLVNAFLKEAAAENGKHVIGIDNKARAVLYGYGWPGNIRELKNCIESAVVMASGETITIDDLPPGIAESAGDGAGSLSIPAGLTLEEAEKRYILQSLAANKDNKSRTALTLGIGRKTLHRKLAEWGMAAPEDD